MSPQGFERIQGLGRVVCDSADYLEGLQAFKQKREPVYRGEQPLANAVAAGLGARAIKKLSCRPVDNRGCEPRTQMCLLGPERRGRLRRRRDCACARERCG